MQQTINRSVTLLLAILLTSCSTFSAKRVIDDSTTDSIMQELEQAKAHNDARQTGTVPPKEVTDGLVSSLMSEFSGEKMPVDQRFDVAAKSLNAESFFLGLVKGTRYNVVVHPEVSGDITLNLSDVSVPETMAVIKDIFGYPVKQSGKLFTVFPAGIRTEVFKINYLNVRRGGISQTRVASGSVSDAGSTGQSNNSSTSSADNQGNTGGSSGGGQVGTFIETSTQTDFWGELKANLELLVGSEDGKKVVVTPQSGIVIVRALPDEIDTVRDYLKSAELIMRRQVLIEAKILEVTLSDDFQSGINWSALGRIGADKTLVFSQGSAAFDLADGLFSHQSPGSSGIPSGSSSNGIFSASMNLKDFAGIIDLLETQGTVQVLSSPRISTINNQKAVIKVGTDEFFVTDVTNTVTTGGSGGDAISTPSVELTPFFSGIALDVTPQISEANEVILHVHPTISDVKEQERSFDVADQNFNLPLAQSSIRESDSIIFAQSDQIVVIGGLIQSVSRGNDSATPWISKVPILGNAFKQRAQSSSKQELVILLKPTVVDTDAIARSISNSLNRIRDMHSEFSLKN